MRPLLVNGVIVMPSFYTHLSFGRKVAERLQGDLKKNVTKYHNQYEIGLQGPDIFFFYKPYSSNHVVEYGHEVHSQVARSFFENAAEKVGQLDIDSPSYGYILGVICHYILDSKCHPFVNRCTDESDISHMEIEEELDKHIMRRDGKSPFGYPLRVFISSEEVTAKAIAPFYDEIKLAEVFKSIRWMKFVKSLFVWKDDMKFKFLCGILKLIGKYDSWRFLMNQPQDDPICTEWNIELTDLFDKAVDEAVEAMKSFEACVKEGAELSARFNKTFG